MSHSYTEIERKFLVKKIPLNLENYESQAIEQAYLSLPGEHNTLRIRMIGSKRLLTIKQPKDDDGLSRHEVEFPIDERDYKALWEMSGSRHIRKTRYYIPWNDLTIELDIFSDQLEGLILAEIEYTSTQEAASQEPPPWFDRELTTDYAYTNSHLAVHGLPKAKNP